MYDVLRKVLEPTNLLLLLLFFTLWRAWRNKANLKRRRFAVTVSFLLLVAYCLPVVAHFSGQYFEREYTQLRSRPADNDVIVILGGGVNPANDKEHKSRLSDASIRRCIHGAELYKSAAACPIIVAGGQANPDPAAGPESHAMRDFLTELGVPESDIVIEDHSTSTHENAIESARILKERSLARPILVTDSLHLRRAVLCFREQGVTVTPSGCGFASSVIEWTPYQFVPRLSAAERNSAVFHEVLGMMWYTIKGRI